MSNLEDPRVLFAAERTLLAWNRTSLSFMAFGFLVERSGLMISIFAPTSLSYFQLSLTFFLGILLIFVGAFSAFISTRQFTALLKTLNPAEFPPGYQVRWGSVINYLVAGFGVVLGVSLATAKFI
jgi:putative membrane protein